MALTWIFANWRILLIATLLGLLSLQTIRLNSANHELELIGVRTTIAQEQSDATIEKLRVSIPVMVEQAHSNAVTNYKRRFPIVSCPVLGGMLPDAGSGQAGLSEGNHELHQPESVALDATTITTCGVDAQLIEAVKAWATLNGLKAK